MVGAELRMQDDGRNGPRWPKDAEDAQAEPVHRTPAVAATTCSSQRRREARVLGSLLLRTLGSVEPLPLIHCSHPRCFESTFFRLRRAVRTQSLRDASQRSEPSPSSFGRFLGRRPSIGFSMRCLSFSVDDLSELNNSGAHP